MRHALPPALVWERDGGTITVAQPCLTVAVFSALGLDRIGPAVERSLALFEEVLGRAALRSLVLLDSDVPEEDEAGGVAALPWDASARRQLRAALLRPRSDEFEGLTFRLSTSLGEEASGAGMRACILDLDGTALPKAMHLLRFDLPLRLGADRPDAVVGFAAMAAAMLEAESAFSACSFHHTFLQERRFRSHAAGAVLRWIGFDPSYDWTCLHMRGHCIPGWLTLLDHGLAARVGLADGNGGLPPGALVRTATHLVLRAARLPPAGDVNRHAPDLGLLPGIARLLRPLRPEAVQSLGLPDEEQAARYLARFDALDDRPWDNAT